MAIKSAAVTLFACALGPALLCAQVLTPASPTPPPPKNIPVVDAAQLIALLPPAPPGWSADKPEGATSDSDDGKLTTVDNVYVNGDADNAPTVAIHIIDAANSRHFQDATKTMWSATSSTPQGYDKAVTIDGLPGFEHYANADQTGVLWVVAGDRFFVQVETTRQPPASSRHGSGALT